MPPKFLISLGSVLIGVGLLGGQTPATESKVDASVEATRQSLKDIELMKKGIAESGKSSPDPALNLSSGLQVPGTSRGTAVQPRQGADALKEAERKQWQADNWLLTGMKNLSQAPDQIASSGSRRSSASGPADDPVMSGPAASNVGQWLAEAMAESEKKAEAMKEAKPGDGRPTSLESPVVNPLDAFMRDWVQPDDLKLLSELGATHGTGSVQPLAGDTLTMPGGALPAGRIERRPVFPTIPGEVASGATNPFLAGWGEGGEATAGPDLSWSRAGSSPDSRALDRSAPPNFPAAVAPSNHQAGEPDPPRQKESWQPPSRTDEKYFPRLKRF